MWFVLHEKPKEQTKNKMKEITGDKGEGDQEREEGMRRRIENLRRN